jgi:excisionase family DNA binding protein
VAAVEWEQLEIDWSAGADVEARTAPTLLVTIRRAGDMLGVGRSTVYELIRALEIEVVHIGRSARVPVASVHAYVDRLRAQSPYDRPITDT